MLTGHASFRQALVTFPSADRGGGSGGRGGRAAARSINARSCVSRAAGPTSPLLCLSCHDNGRCGQGCSMPAQAWQGPGIQRLGASFLGFAGRACTHCLFFLMLGSGRGIRANVSAVVHLGGAFLEEVSRNKPAINFAG